MNEHYRQREKILAQAMADRQEWEHATAGVRGLAIAADAELRRRHPDQTIESLRSAEPAPVTDTESDRQHAVPDERIGQMTEWIRDLAAQRGAFRAALERRQTPQAASDDPSGWRDLGGLHTWRTLGQDAILQPPKPSIVPSTRILQRAEHDIEPEAGD